jgi:hypothetical protein
MQRREPDSWEFICWAASHTEGSTAATATLIWRSLPKMGSIRPRSRRSKQRLRPCRRSWPQSSRSSGPIAGSRSGVFRRLIVSTTLITPWALIERKRVNPIRPTLQEIRSYLGGAPFASWAASAAHFAGLDTLGSDERKPYLRALLYPARFITNWMTGGMASNDDAVAFLNDRQVPGLDFNLVAAALQCRRDARDPTIFFPLEPFCRGKCRPARGSPACSEPFHADTTVR